MRIILLSVILFYYSDNLFSQEQTVTLDFSAYFKEREKVDSLMVLKKYKEAAFAFSKAFAINNQMYPKGDRYKAAKVWALAGNKDSAFFNLDKEVSSDFADYDKLISENAFSLLKKDARWASICRKVKARQDKENARLGKYSPIKKELERRLALDQKYRGKMWVDIESKFGIKSKEYRSFTKKVIALDKDNLAYVKGVLDTCGWISHDTIGMQASLAMFLIIQHADSAIQEKYLPLLRQAVKEKKANAGYLALLEDRVLITRGEKQLYGSQVTCDDSGKNCKPFPIDDEKNVDERRKAMGLLPLAVYLKDFGIEYKKPEN